MCGRFVRTVAVEKIRERFGVPAKDTVSLLPSFNVAPGNPVLAVIPGTPGKLAVFSWGMVPSWKQSGRRSSSLIINARSESIRNKPLFREAFMKRRCLIPADGFYEWHTANGRRVPYLFRLRSRALFGFAAIWNDPEKGAKRSLPACAILTTCANALVRGIHPRMPVLVRREHEPLWGAPKTCDFEGMSALLAPYPGEEMERFRVTSRVNAASYDSPGCVEPLEEEDEGSQMKLFS